MLQLMGKIFEYIKVRTSSGEGQDTERFAANIYMLSKRKNQKSSKFYKSYPSQSTKTLAEVVSVPQEFNSAGTEVGLLPEDENLAQRNTKGCKKEENILNQLIRPGALLLVRQRCLQVKVIPNCFFSSLEHFVVM